MESLGPAALSITGLTELLTEHHLQTLHPWPCYWTPQKEWNERIMKEKATPPCCLIRVLHLPFCVIQMCLSHGLLSAQFKLLYKKNTLQPFSVLTNGVDGWIAQFPSNPRELAGHVCWEYNGVRKTHGPTESPELQKSLVFLSVCESSLPSLLPLTGLSVAFN